MSHEAFCALGGETEVQYEHWRTSGRERKWIIVQNDKAEIEQATCIKPLSCQFSEHCTGKVCVGNASSNSLGKPIILSLILKSQWVVDQLVYEADYGISSL